MSCNKDLIFLKGFASDKKYLRRAIEVACIAHKGQKRKTGEDYIDHPTTVAMFLFSLGIKDEEILSIAMLHDVVEDTNISPEELLLKYKMSERIVTGVTLVSKEEGYNEKTYYKEISQYPEAAIVKVADRCHNISTMVNAFSDEKIKGYIEETQNYILPLCKEIRRNYTEYADQMVVMQFMLKTLNKTYLAFLNQ